MFKVFACDIFGILIDGMVGVCWRFIGRGLKTTLIVELLFLPPRVLALNRAKCPFGSVFALVVYLP